MRKLLWTAVALVLIGLVIVATAAVSLNRIIAHNRDRILERARAGIGREVAADRIVMSVWGGLGLRVDNVRVADDPHFSDADFLRAGAVIAHAKLLPLLRGRIDVGRIVLQQPRMQLIRDASGRWNYATIGGAATSAGSGATGPAAPAGGAPEQLPFLIGRANIEDGALLIIDRGQRPPRTTALQRIDLAVSDISQSTPISFQLDAALQADAANIRVHGTVGPLTDLGAIPLRLGGSLGPLGSQQLRVDALQIGALVTPASVQVSQLDGRAFGGAFRLSGLLPLRPDGTAALKGELTHVAVAQVLRLTSEDAARRISGAGALQLDLRATGGSADAMRSSLSGRAAADIQDASLKDFNLVREVLGRLTDLPVVGDLVSRSVKPKYARLAADPDTRFRTLRATFQIKDQRMHTDDLTVEAGDFGVRAAGWIGFDQEVDLTGVLAMSTAFSGDVAADIKEAKHLLDDQGQLALPFRLRGKLGVAKPQPDTGYLISRLTRGMAPGGLKDLLGNLLGGKPQPAGTPKSKDAEDAVQQGLRKLFGR